jgi:RNA polymerase sigma-70 factor, ECF subfamily
MSQAVSPAAQAASSMSDEELAREVLGGRLELFELIMRRNNQRVYRAVRSLLRNESDAEDAMQQAYVSAFTHLSSFAGNAKLSTWLVRIAINEALGRLRRAKKFVALEAVDDAVLQDGGRRFADAEDTVANHEIAAALGAAVDQLADIYRVVFMLREVEGMSTEETAEALDISTDTVKTRLHRAKADLQRRLAHLVVAHAGRTFEFPATRCDRVVLAVLRQIGA